MKAKHTQITDKSKTELVLIVQLIQKSYISVSSCQSQNRCLARYLEQQVLQH